VNKRKLHHVWKKLRLIKPWYFLVLALICGVICALSLRSNNEHMIVLKKDVINADQNNGDVQTALRNLQNYVTTHMNTDLGAGPNAVYPPIQLKYTYERLVKAQSDAISAANTQIYTDAQAYCEQQNSHDVSGRNRVPCIEQYVTDHGGQTVKTIPDSLYKFSFVSPRWSPDLAGWSLVATIIFAVMFVVMFIARKLLRKAVS
jgi:preprotein translocase subunit SecF